MSKKLSRSLRERMLGGVCGGLATYLGIDAVLVRLVVVLLAMFGGQGFIIYLLAWIIIPEERFVGKVSTCKEEDETKEETDSSLSANEGISADKNIIEVEPEQKQISSPHLLLGLILIMVGAFFLVRNFFPWFFAWGRFWPLALVALGLFVLFNGKRSENP